MAQRTERGNDVAQRDQRLVNTTALFQAVAASTGSVRPLASDVNKERSFIQTTITPYFTSTCIHVCGTRKC